MVGYIAPDRVRGLTTLRAKSPETARATGRPQHDSSAKSEAPLWFSWLRARGKRYKQFDRPAGINLRTGGTIRARQVPAPNVSRAEDSRD
jgi:hypothetical protein